MASGARAMAPMMLSYLPFGLLLGTAVARCANP
jgi:predicted branched-subunit amino acid permease